MGDNFTKGLILIGRGGLFGSTLGLLVGIGFWKDTYINTILNIHIQEFYLYLNDKIHLTISIQVKFV